jgi:hypothetical protein
MDPSIEPFKDWVRHLPEAEELDVSILEDFDFLIRNLHSEQLDIAE